MGCQTSIAQKILDRGADYLLALKGNYRQARQAVGEYFTSICVDRDAPGRAVLDEFDDGHGRLVRRRVFVSTEAAGLDALRCWPGLHAVLAVETIRSINGTAKTVAEWRYYLTSGHDAHEVLAGAIRKHWTIENNLHWVLDMTFREDESRVRDRIAARNLAVLRKVALNLISRDQASKTSKRGRRKQAAWNDNYMLQLLRI